MSIREELHQKKREDEINEFRKEILARSKAEVVETWNSLSLKAQDQIFKLRDLRATVNSKKSISDHYLSQHLKYKEFTDRESYINKWKTNIEYIRELTNNKEHNNDFINTIYRLFDRIPPAIKAELFNIFDLDVRADLFNDLLKYESNREAQIYIYDKLSGSELQELKAKLIELFPNTNYDNLLKDETISNKQANTAFARNTDEYNNSGSIIQRTLNLRLLSAIQEQGPRQFNSFLQQYQYLSQIWEELTDNILKNDKEVEKEAIAEEEKLKSEADQAEQEVNQFRKEVFGWRKEYYDEEGWEFLESIIKAKNI
jgi:hypothetical protein